MEKVLQSNNITYLFMVGFFGGYDRGISNEGKMDSWVWDQVSLKFIQINIKSPIEPKGCSDGGYYLCNDAI